MELPTRIILTSGIRIGSTKLNAFDNALLNAGIGNFNLLSVSSIIPPKAKIIYLTKDNREKLLPEIGSEEVPIIKINTRSLWFISRDELDKLLKDKDVQVENESREPTGINNLEGVTIYGRFQ